MTKRVSIIGTGLIGGSIGLGLRAASDVHVTGWDASAERLSGAVDAGAIHEAASSVEDACREADLIILATPVGAIVPTVEAIAACIRAGAVVTDVGSTKGQIVERAERMLSGSAFVGGHPMAGTEGEGIEAARADLFNGALWIVTPTRATDPDAYREVNTMAMDLGAHTLALDPAEHDRIVALVSHLPYALGTSLMTLALEQSDARIFQAAAGSFRDITRTAGSNPSVWRDIFATNKDAIVGEIDRLSETLRRLRNALQRSQWDQVDALISSAREARRRFPAKGERSPVDPVSVDVNIRDQAGALARVTNIVGSGGVNIEDIWIEHTSAGGVLRIVVDGENTAGRVIEVLAAEGFRASMVSDA